MARVEIPYIVSQDDGTNADGAQVLITVRSSGAPATVYAAETGGGTASNPITVNNGRVEGWLDEGSYNFSVSGTGITGYTQPVEFVRGDGVGNVANGVITNAKVANDTLNLSEKALDGSLTLDKLAAEIQRQFVPIGGVIDWYRPATGVPVPPGFVICDGLTTLNDTQHDFGSGITFTVPDMRNAFILGANISNADGSAGSAGDSSTNAPGIGGNGGSNAVRNLSHSHTVNSHTHSISTESSHSHTVNSHTHRHFSPIGMVSGNAWVIELHEPDLDGIGSYALWDIPQSVETRATGSGATQNVERWVVTSEASSPGTNSSGSHSHGGATGSQGPGTNSALSSIDFRPRWYGLLKIMKVKRA